MDQAPADETVQVSDADAGMVAGLTEMSVIDHLEEMRMRIFKSLGAVTVTATGVFIFNGPIIHVLELPLAGMPGVVLIFTSPGEYFMAIVKVSLMGGLYLALPVVLYQFIAFVGPGLLPGERKWAVPTVLGAFFFFSIGGLFAYLLLLPAGLQFLVGFAPTEVKAMLSIGKYLGFAAGLVFATGLAFELPLFLLGASAMGVVTSYSLAEQRKNAFFAAFVLAAVITPSVDVFSQVSLATALYLLFEMSIGMIRFTGK